MERRLVITRPPGPGLRVGSSDRVVPKEATLASPESDARGPGQIRGFESVKEQQLADAKAKEAELLAAFRLRAPAATVRQAGGAKTASP